MISVYGWLDSTVPFIGSREDEEVAINSLWQTGHRRSEKKISQNGDMWELVRIQRISAAEAVMETSYQGCG